MDTLSLLNSCRYPHPNMKIAHRLELIKIPRQKNVHFRSLCFKCEGDHKLDHCSKFKYLVVVDRVAFCARHILCFGCLGGKHSVRFCNQKKPFKVAGCHLHHHELLHDLAKAANHLLTESSRTETARIGNPISQRVSMGMVRLKILDGDGNAVWANSLH